jgi:L-rhamnose mutarotase
MQATVWRDILAMIQTCHIRNRSIYFKSVGRNFVGSLTTMAGEPKIQNGERFASRAQDEWWAGRGRDEIFHFN